MNDDELRLFLNVIHRIEANDNPTLYTKAVRVTLLALGYDADWVNGDFREALDKYAEEWL